MEIRGGAPYRGGGRLGSSGCWTGKVEAGTDREGSRAQSRHVSPPCDLGCALDIGIFLTTLASRSVDSLRNGIPLLGREQGENVLVHRSLVADLEQLFAAADKVIAAASFKEDVYNSLKGKPVTVVTNGAIFKEEELQRCALMHGNPIQACLHVGFKH